MKTAKSGRLAAVLLAVIAVLGGVALLKGGFYLAKHEGDTMHLAELVIRMTQGEWPHLDFMTPIGVMAFAPLVMFMELGAGLGNAVFLAQILLALLLLPVVLRLSESRIPGIWGYVYGIYVMVLCLALIHGEAQLSVSVSMHYNRWAWAVAYAILPLALIAPREGREAPALDGALIGVGFALLVLTKVTYAVALGPGILVALMARRQWRTLGFAVLGGLAIAAVPTALKGFDFWMAYLRDLATVAGSDIRAQPGEAFTATIATPQYLAISLTLIGSIILLRQAGRAVEGMALLFLMPGFFYIVYQNFGNDPQWLMLLGVMLFVLLPPAGTRGAFGIDLRDGLRIAGLLAFAFAAPSVINLAYSPLRHLAQSTEDTISLLPQRPELRDVFSEAPRQYQVNFVEAGDGPGTPFASFAALADRDDVGTLMGAPLPQCRLEGGFGAWFSAIADDLTQAGYAGKSIVTADLFSLYWAFGDFPTVRGAAPWYYGGLSGVANADYVLVPRCPIDPRVRKGMIADLEKQGWQVSEVRRTDLYVLIEAKKPASD